MGNTTSARKRPKVDEQYTRPQGLYPDRDRDVDAKKLRRLILDGKLAPCYPGMEEAHADLEECPICFLHYPSLNNSRCCKKGICTECFLQMKSPIASRPTRCPFCKTPGYAVEHGGPKSAALKAMEVEEDQRVIEATLRMRQEEQLKSEERAKKREKDLSEGRVPEPPSPTLFPASPLRFPAFPPAAPGQSPHGANTPQQAPGQPPVPLGQGSIVRSGSEGARRRSFPSRRVSAIEPDNLWFRAGSTQASASNSRRTSAAGQSLEESPSTADSWPNPNATAGTVGLDAESAEDGGEGPMAVLRAMANTGSDVVGMDLDDVMLNEAIWLSLQEEEERQRRSSGRLPPMDGSTNEPVGRSPDTEASVPGYQDPDEAAASELARALAASLEQSAAWGSASVSGSGPLPGTSSGSRGVAAGLQQESGAGVQGSSSAQGSAMGSAESSGSVFDEPEGLGRSSTLEDGTAVKRRLEGSLDAEVRTGGVNAGESLARLTAVVDGTTVSGPFRGSALAEVSGLTEDLSQECDGAGEPAGGLLPEHSDSRGRGDLAEATSTRPFDTSTEGAGVRPLLQARGADGSALASSVNGLTPSSSGASRGQRNVPLFGHLRADSVYRSTADRDQEVATSDEGFVSSTIGLVEPLSLAELAARKSLTGPSPRSARKSDGAETEAQPKGVNGPSEELPRNNMSTGLSPSSVRGGSDGVAVSKSESPRLELKNGGGLKKQIPEKGGVGWPESKETSESRRESGAGARVANQEPGEAQMRPDSEPGSWGRFTDRNAFAPSNPFAPMHAFARKEAGVAERHVPHVEPGLSPQFLGGSSLNTGRPKGARASSVEPTPSVNPLGADGDLYPSPHPVPAKIGMGKDLGSGLEPGFQKRRARSLSGSSNKVHGEPWTSTIYSPVKYPPPRNSTGPENLINAGRIYQRSVTSKDASVVARSEVLRASAEAKQVVPLVQTALIDASFEEQLSAAIALSLAEVEAEEKRRKQNEAFEREALSASLETQTLS